MPTDKSAKRSRRTKTKRKRDKTATKDRERTNTLPRLDNTVERVPSNAPTMAIAPSDYEHIFHEGPAGSAAGGANEPTQAQSPTSPPGPQQTPPPPQLTASMSRRQGADDYSSPPTGRQAYMADVQVTPDGYTLLGHQPAEMTGGRRVALPAHVVRASNQFSRAALARVARYLASRSDYR